VASMYGRHIPIVTNSTDSHRSSDSTKKCEPADSFVQPDPLRGSLGSGLETTLHRTRHDPIHLVPCLAQPTRTALKLAYFSPSITTRSKCDPASDHGVDACSTRCSGHSTRGTSATLPVEMPNRTSGKCHAEVIPRI
jgi:hypothetical protein